MVYAAIVLFVCVPAVLLCIRDYPAECGLEPYGEAADDAQGAAPVAVDSADAERRAWACMATPAFILLLVAGFLMNMVCQVNGFLPKYVYWVDSQSALGVMPAAFVAGVILSSLTQAGSATGKFILGAFSDFSVRKALVLLCSGGAAGIACVWMLPSTVFMVIAVSCMVSSWPPCSC